MDVTVVLEVFVGIVANALAAAVDGTVQLRMVRGTYDATGDFNGAETAAALGGVDEVVLVVILLDIAHRGHVAAAVDILANDGAVADADGGIAVGSASDEGGLNNLEIGGVVDGGVFAGIDDRFDGTGGDIDVTRVVIVRWRHLATVAAAKDGTEVVLAVGGYRVGNTGDEGADGAAGDLDVGVLKNNALLGTAIDVTHDDTVAADVNERFARVTHGDPVRRLGVDIPQVSCIAGRFFTS